MKHVEISEKLAADLLNLTRDYVREAGGCEHDVGVCMCAEISMAEALNAAITNTVGRDTMGDAIRSAIGDIVTGLKKHDIEVPAIQQNIAGAVRACLDFVDRQGMIIKGLKNRVERQGAVLQKMKDWGRRHLTGKAHESFSETMREVD